MSFAIRTKNCNNDHKLYLQSMKYNCLLILLQAACLPLANGYITAGLPGHKHRAWLKQMTVEVCDTAPGELTQEMCNKTPQLLSAWAQNPYVPHTKGKTEANVFPHHGKECAIFCEKLLKRLVDEKRAGNQNAIANTQTYNALIDVWSRSGERGGAAQRAEEILIGMQDAYSSGQEEVQPDLGSFRLVLKAWDQAKNEIDAPHRAHMLLKWMVSLYESGENTNAAPDADCFDIVLHSWASSKHEDAPQMAEKVIMCMDRMYNNGNEDVKPTRENFNKLLTAWSKSKQPLTAARRVQDILNHMILHSKSGDSIDLTPNIATYHAVIAAWAKSKDDDCGRRAEAVLNQVEEQYRVTQDEELCPDAIMFNLVIDAHAKTSSNKAHLKALNVLDRQIDLYEKGNKKCKPDVYSFTSVLSSCASLNGSASRQEKVHAFEVALSTFSEMSRFNLVPNHVTYGMMLKACSRLLPLGKERRESTREFFSKACEDGCVGDMVLNRLEDAAPPAQYNGLMKGLTRNTVPSEWTCKVPEKEMYTRKGKNHSYRKNTKVANMKNELRL